ncbi:MAG TPA: signal peptidase I, partial [Polyangiaceae bacterium]|nr:signal peptidase I [Polyangiaceae bacterium]
GAVGLVLHLFLFEVWRVPSDDSLLAASIEPTLSAGDLVVVTRRTSVDRGELLRCADPEATGRFVVARAIGRYGDRVELKDDVVSLDGKHVPSPRACDPPSMTVHDPRIDDDVTLSCSVEDYGDVPFSVLRAPERPEPPTHVTVEAGKWFLVSDDRHVHLDSRDYGEIDASTCQHVLFRLVGAAGFGDARRRLIVVW